MNDERGIRLFKNQSFWTRLITSIILAVIFAGIFILGFTIMLCVLCIISLIGLWEFYRAEKLLWKPFAFIGFLVDILYYILIRFYDGEYTSLYLIFLFVGFAIADIIIYIFNYQKYSLHELFASYFSVFYIGVTLSFLYITRVHAWGAYLVWLAIFASWGSDVFAYMGGMLFGKHKVFPEISPKKTLEGCISGILGAGLCAFIYALCVQNILIDTAHEVIIFPLVCMAGAVIGMIGDLFASAIKRNVGIKDYSNLLPGHGGILDRFDSVILVAPVVYVATILFRIWQ